MSDKGWAPWPGLAPYGREAQVDGLRVFYYEAGDPGTETVLLLHGLGDEADSWRHVLAPLAARYHVLAPDLPGFGRSAKPARSYTTQFFLEAVQGLLAERRIERLTVAGSSLGAVLAQELALQKPDRVASLVLLDGSLYLRSRPLQLMQVLMLVPGVGEWLYGRLRDDAEAAYATLAPYYADLEGLPGADRAFLRERVQARVADRAQQRAYLSALRRLVVAGVRRQRTIAGELAGLKVPALVVWGAKDALMPVENGHALAETLPEAQLVVVEEAGHLPHQEEPEVVVEAIRAHLAAVWGSGPDGGGAFQDGL